jgi:hypothetical protein
MIRNPNEEKQPWMEEEPSSPGREEQRADPVKLSVSEYRRIGCLTEKGGEPTEEHLVSSDLNVDPQPGPWSARKRFRKETKA